MKLKFYNSYAMLELAVCINFTMSPSFECKDFKSIKRVVYLIHTAQPVDVPCRNTLGLPVGD